MRRLAVGVAVLCLASAGVLEEPSAAGAADAAALAERLVSQPFDASALENGSRFLDAGETEIGEQLRSYGVVGSSWFRVDDRTGAGTVVIFYYVFLTPAAADAFAGQYTDWLVQASQSNWRMDFPIAAADPEIGDIAGSCIATDTVNHANCLFREPSLPVIIQVSAWMPDIPPGISDGERKDLVGQRAGRATQDVLAAARRHLAAAAGVDLAAIELVSDPGVLADRLLQLPFDASMLAEGYRYTDAYTVIDGIPEGWDMQSMVMLDFAGPGDETGKLIAYLVFPSIDAAGTFYEGYPAAWKSDVGAQGWAEILDLVHANDDTMREFQLPCIASEVDTVTICLEHVTGTPIVISIILPTSAVDGMNADDRALALAGQANVVVSALLPAARVRVADALLAEQ